MTGNRYSNMFIRRHHYRDTKERGQILLITVMLLAAAVTVVMTIAFNSTTETQITKMEEDSQSALSAAETALEAAIQKKATVALSDPSFNSMFSSTGITGEATVVEMGGNEFVTPLLQRDEQYTFYLANYNKFRNLQPADYWSGDMVMYLQSEGSGCTPSTSVALEMTMVASDNTVSEALIDPCGLVGGDSTNRIATLAGGSVKDSNFSLKIPATGTILQGISGKKLLIIRVLGAPTRIGFTGTNMETQGRVITSQAKTATGVMKKIQLFQSYPQIPSDFFVTSF